MYSGPKKLWGALLVLLVLPVAASRMEAQTKNLFDSSRPSLAEQQAALQKSSPAAVRERIPLEGKIDRSSYRLGPGDEVDVSIWGGELYESHHLFVSPEGRLLVPPAGPLEVDGMTLEEAESRLIRLMSEYYAEARITLTLVNPRVFRVFAVGALHRPGSYFMSAVDRVGALVDEAGGVKPGGSRRRVRLLDGDRRLLKTVDLMQYSMKGDLEQNPLLVDGCIVEVPPLDNYVLLRGSFTNLSGSDSVDLGERQRDQINEFVVEYLPGETMGDLLGLVGGPDIVETVAGGWLAAGEGPGKTRGRVPLTRELIEGSPEKGAVYEFPVRNKWVFVSGSVNQPGRFIYQPGWTVGDYLAMAGGPGNNGSGKACYLRRLDSQAKCGAGDEVLPGDVIFVPQRSRFYEWAFGPLVTLVTGIIVLSNR
ncbi:MAG: SLBB domain-containing protein [Candidatus Glassbacteria bacterium]|nr:SLBB domain-containing protein [Candidatus Glassbacteria bacterium]